MSTSKNYCDESWDPAVKAVCALVEGSGGVVHVHVCTSALVPNHSIELHAPSEPGFHMIPPPNYLEVDVDYCVEHSAKDMFHIKATVKYKNAEKTIRRTFCRHMFDMSKTCFVRDTMRVMLTDMGIAGVSGSHVQETEVMPGICYTMGGVLAELLTAVKAAEDKVFQSTVLVKGVTVKGKATLNKYGMALAYR